MRYPLPPKTRQAIDKQNSPKNPGLLFERFLPMMEKDGDGDEKKKALDDVVKAARQADKSLLADWVKRWQAFVVSAHAEPFTAKTDWRFVTGLGRKGALEVGFTFHRYGFPILPGSSVKGVARAYAHLAFGKDKDDPDFCAIFGRSVEQGEKEDVSQSGGAIFFDALPTSDKLPELVVDIMNPHYRDYYQSKGEAAPTNWQNPNPVMFLTVKEKTSFRFAVGWRGAWNDEAKRLRDLAVEWLQHGLAELGAGAKTSAGYGYFELVEKKETPGEIETAAVEMPMAVSALPAHPPKGADWKKGEISGDGKYVYAPDAPDNRFRFQREHVLPKGYTPASKAEVQFIAETLPDGSQRVWVKRMYYPVE